MSNFTKRTFFESLNVDIKYLIEKYNYFTCKKTDKTTVAKLYSEN